jgi:ketosteroid isomerase-like protein
LELGMTARHCVKRALTIARDEAGIRETMATHDAALIGGKTAAVLPLYTEDGVFMPPYSQPGIGKSAVAAAYDKVFEELQFDVKFHDRRTGRHSAELGLCAHQLGWHNIPPFTR